jgi:hypothetical protein
MFITVRMKITDVQEYRRKLPELVMEFFLAAAG